LAFFDNSNIGLETMVITFVCPPDALTGGLRVISIYAGMLADRGHTVRVVLPRDPPPGGRKARLLSFLRGLASLGRKSRRPPSFFDAVGCEVIRLDHSGPIVDRDLPDADIVVATWWETVEWVWGLSRRKGRKVHFMQDYEIWVGQEDRVDAACALPIPKIIIARWVEELLRSRWAQTPLAYIPNSVEGEKFNAPVRTKQAVPTVGMTYTPMRNKGCDISLAAIAKARESVPELRLVAFGSCPPTRQLPLPADTEFHFKVADSELPFIYGKCDAWLFGTRKEGFGLPILEAMACRTPVIGTRAGAAPELLEKGGGVLVDLEDVDGMARAMVSICGMTEGEWRAMSDRALATTREYTWRDATDRFESALGDVMKTAD
jgi:glycosyltransferase involved in cell wall biosynthesis